jgi:hypothetical protein
VNVDPLEELKVSLLVKSLRSIPALVVSDSKLTSVLQLSPEAYLSSKISYLFYPFHGLHRRSLLASPASYQSLAIRVLEKPQSGRRKEK